MKKRNSFVSNSSSTSFIFISDSKYDIDVDYIKNQFIIIDNVLWINDNDGQQEFGWEHEEYDDIKSKIKYAYLQTRCCNLVDENKMLKEVLCECLKVTNVIFNMSENDSWIDHQSCIYEDPDLRIIFDSKENLKNFIFNPNSYVKQGNDNE